VPPPDDPGSDRSGDSGATVSKAKFARQGARLTAAERRSQILDAAREVFMVDGISGARTRRIAEVAGINEALLYQHFSSKEEIFEEAVVKPRREMIANVSGGTSRLPSSTRAERPSGSSRSSTSPSWSPCSGT
jgi:hypothetical protein